MKKQLLIVVLSILCYTTNAQNVNIPDAAFKSYLVGNTSVNKNGDAEIQESEAQAFSGNLNIPRGVADLTGIEAFAALTGLRCFQNGWPSLDLSQNVALKILDCGYNKFTSLDLSKNTALEELYCNGNFLSSLDISSNTALKVLECEQNELTALDLSLNTALLDLKCQYNQLTSLDLSKNTALKSVKCSMNQLTSLSLNIALEELNCDYNELTSLDLSKNKNLISLSCNSNKLTSLDISANTALIWVDCSGNKLKSLDPSSNKALVRLTCSENQLVSLDVSANSVLTQLYCSVNELTYLNIANGNNANLVGFLAIHNMNLAEIIVDDASTIATNPLFANYYEGVVFTDNNTTTGISDTELNNSLVIYPNPASSVLHIETRETTSIKIVAILGEEVLSSALDQQNNTIDVSALSPGIYFLQSPKGEVLKFVKE